MGRLGMRSIGARMIVATVALLTIVLAAFVVMVVRELRSLGESEAEARGSAVELAMSKMAMALSRETATASAAALNEGSYSYLQSLVEQTAKEEADVRFVLVADDTGAVVADSRSARTRGRVLDDPVTTQVKEQPAGGVVVTHDPADDKLWIFATPIVVGTGVLGQARVGIDTTAKEREVANARDAARDKVDRVMRIAPLVALALLVIGVVVAVAQAVRLSRPLVKLSAQAERIAGGDLAESVDVGGGSQAAEIAQLSHNFNYMAAQIRVLLDETARKVALEKEVEIAQIVQESLVPSRDVVTLGPLEIAGSLVAAHRCGGDWWTYRRLGKGADSRHLVLIGDVTGHGIPSALISAAAVGCCDALPPDVTPDGALAVLNRTILGAGKGRFAMSTFACLFDARTSPGTVAFANAGHTIPYHVTREGGKWRLGALTARGSLLGEVEGTEFVVRTKPLAPGDLVVLYTDGVNECTDREGKRFGHERLRNALRDAVASGATEPNRVRDSVMSTLERHAADAHYEDDVTLVVIRWMPESAAVAGDERGRVSA